VSFDSNESDAWVRFLSRAECLLPGVKLRLCHKAPHVRLMTQTVHSPLFPQAHVLEDAFDQEVASLPLERKNIIQTCRDLFTENFP